MAIHQRGDAGTVMAAIFQGRRAFTITEAGGCRPITPTIPHISVVPFSSPAFLLRGYPGPSILEWDLA
jgi:hypothetical protein